MPAIFSGIIWFYQTTVIFTTKWVIIYFAFIAFWTTVMIERWKRKEHFIGYKWGKFSEKSHDEQIVINPSFLGFHKFSWSSD